VTPRDGRFACKRVSFLRGRVEDETVARRAVTGTSGRTAYARTSRIAPGHRHSGKIKSRPRGGRAGERTRDSHNERETGESVAVERDLRNGSHHLNPHDYYTMRCTLYVINKRREKRKRGKPRSRFCLPSPPAPSSFSRFQSSRKYSRKYRPLFRSPDNRRLDAVNNNYKAPEGPAS